MSHSGERFIVVTDHVDWDPARGGSVCHAGEIVPVSECHNLQYKWPPVCLLSPSYKCQVMHYYYDDVSLV